MNKDNQAVINFGSRLRYLRKISKLTQTDLASLSGLHYTYIGAVERAERNPSLKSMEKLARGLGRNIREFFPRPLNLSPEESKIEEVIEAIRGGTLKELQLILAMVKAVIQEQKTEEIK